MFGDVFSAGPVCLFSVFLAVYMSGIEKKEEVRDVACIDNGPGARLWAGRILSWGPDFCWPWGRASFCGCPEPGGLPSLEMVCPKLFVPVFFHPGRKE